MLEPAIEGKATDHALFCKYAGELLERVTGKTLAKSTVVPSLSRITKVLQFSRIFCGKKHLFIISAGQVLSSLCFVLCIGRPLGLETVLV